VVEISLDLSTYEREMMRRVLKATVYFVVLITLCYSCSENKSSEKKVQDGDIFSPSETKNFGLIKGKPKRFHSQHLNAEILVLPGVFYAGEAIKYVLPFMQENKELFEGKTILEIGTGSGIIGIYAAKLGAKKVVATDINKTAIVCANQNAQALGVSSIIETRLVPLTDISAYSVIAPDESFDVIISNPPYSLDLDAQENTAVVDRGDLGFSIVRGLDTHMKPSGVAILLYKSLFYHHVMVKFAKHVGYQVRNQVPDVLTSFESEALFNFYLTRLLEHEHIDSNAFRFDREKDNIPFLRNLIYSRLGLLERLRKFLSISKSNDDSLIAHPGIIVIRRN